MNKYQKYIVAGLSAVNQTIGSVNYFVHDFNQVEQ
jgi:hypothetical protein